MTTRYFILLTGLLALSCRSASADVILFEDF